MSSSSRRSAAARFWAPLLGRAKISDLEDFEGRVRPWRDGSLSLVPEAIREERVVVKARFDEEGASDVDCFWGFWPYSPGLDIVAWLLLFDIGLDVGELLDSVRGHLSFLPFAVSVEG